MPDPVADRNDILVVDDEQDFRRTLVDILESVGYGVGQAGDGATALEALKDRAYRLVVMDIRMPRKDGVSTLADMQKMRPETPVIMVTAYRPDHGEQPVLEKHAAAVLGKPLDMECFLKAVRRHCPPSRADGKADWFTPSI